MRDRVEKIKQVAGELEIAEIQVLYNSYLHNMNAANDSKDEKAIRNLEASRKSLERRVAEIKGKYYTRGEAFPDIMAAVRYLKDQGWKISKSKAHQDARCNPPKLKIGQDSSLAEAEVMAYAARKLKKISGAAADGEHSELGIKKVREELEYQQLRNKKLRFEIDKDHGLFLPKEAVRAELAVKLGALDALVKNGFRANTVDYIVAVGGDIKKADMLVAMFNAEHDRRMNHLAELKDFEIEFTLDENQ